MKRTPSLITSALAFALSLGMAGCADLPLAPPPAISLAPAFREAPAGWNDGQAMHALMSESWWEIYQDSELDTLQRQLLANSPDLASTLALYQQARAATDMLRAAQSPGIGATVNAQRDRQSDRRPLRGASSPEYCNSATLGLEAAYEVDLWGRIRQQVSAGVAQERAAEADLAAARLSLQAQLTDTLLALRGVDQQSKLLDETVAAYTRAQQVIEARHQAGLSSGLDLAQAQTQRNATLSQARQLLAQRAVLEHAIAALVGENASTFKIAARVVPAVSPAVPLGVPSMLLQRRPDIAAAQLRVAASSARAGVAKSAFFPSLTLSANAGLQSGELGKVLQMPNLFWAIGPTLALDLVDGGRRKAAVRDAEAALEESGQRYRMVVLLAFQQVEDQLALLKHYGEAAIADRSASAASRQALELANIRYRQGASAYLDVVTAQAANLQAQRSELELTTRKQRASVQLIRALGGGWPGAGRADG